MDQDFTILIIEDDRYIANFMALSLKKEQYQTVIAATAQEGLALCYANHPGIILLDLGLPDMDGLAVIKTIRSFSQVPILVVSARGQEQEKIDALDSGADDYIVKPFHMGELLARIRVVRRKAQQPALGTVFTCAGLTMDQEKHRVIVDDKEVHLTPMEYHLLQLLIANKGKVLTHNYIIKEIWGYGETGDPKAVRVFMANLRRKIEKDTLHPRFILTEIGVGYRFAEE
jgi:two-component system, OmpR family, KDP operon response regulator KdpE